MSNQAIQQISDIVVSTISRPFTHEELLNALDGVANRNPACSSPHLAMAIAFGLGHRDLDALKRHLSDAGIMLTHNTTAPHDLENNFLKALYTVLENEVLLLEYKRKSHLSGIRVGTEQLFWSQLVAASETSLSQLDQQATPLNDSELIKTITPAIQAQSLSTQPDSEQFHVAVKALSKQFWGGEKMQELAGFFLMFDHYKCNNLTEATSVGEEMIRRNPNCLIAHTTLGNTYYFSQRFDEALVCYQQAVALAPQNAQVHLGHAKVAWRVGQLDEATCSLAKAKRLDVRHRLSPLLGHIDNLLKLSKKFPIRPIVRPVR